MTAALEDLVRDYLRVRRAMGYKLDHAEYILVQFITYMHAQPDTPVTIEHALEFATAPAGAAPRWQALRLSTIRCFARWAHTIDPDIQIPPSRLLPARPTRSAPYIYTEEQIGQLLAAADRLRTPLRAASYRTLIAVMAALGLRTGEALGMDTTDLDQGAATLTVTGKYDKVRILPLHPTVLHGITDYLHHREQLLPAPTCPALLISTTGNRLRPSNVHETFRRLTTQAGLRTSSSASRPRLTDLRHTFAVNTMLDAYRSGQDPAAVLPILSTWLGHVQPSDTYWYLTGTSELMTAANDRLRATGQPHDGGKR